jgi:hypothetical protein
LSVATLLNTQKSARTSIERPAGVVGFGYLLPVIEIYAQVVTQVTDSER